MIFRLGVTGGIGSGKSTVCKVFKVLGIPVFSADDEARIIMDNNKIIRAELKNIIGTDLYVSGELDRSKMASIIFNDDNLLNKVNNLVHPLVFDRYDNWCRQQDADYVIFEAAILFESGADKHVDRILAVTATREERINRVMKRNKMSREQVMERISKQMEEDEMIKRSDYRVNNSDDSMIIKKVLDIHRDILSDLKKA
ncbi:MAG: dephospho-CoA kinase [Bacteroidales bacterium]